MIHYFKFEQEVKPTFSILIPTWNNLELLKLCISSIKKNSKYNHEIIVHVNENEDKTKDWLNEQEISHTFTEINIGICKAVNSAYSLSSSDYIVYINDDMYVCPDWDLYLKKEIDSINSPYFYLSASLIEPVFSGNISVAAPFDFGRDISSFNENKLLKEFDRIEITDKNGSSWPPSVMHRKLWDLIGGFSIEFSPGMYSDPDISMKLWKAGVRYFKIVGKSRVYHFMSKSTKKVKRNNGRKQFLKKWNISSSTFYKHYLQMGTKFTGKLEEPKLDFSLKKSLLKDKIKLFFYN